MTTFVDWLPELLVAGMWFFSLWLTIAVGQAHSKDIDTLWSELQELKWERDRHVESSTGPASHGAWYAGGNTESESRCRWQ